jgi:hypothetical protein
LLNRTDYVEEKIFDSMLADCNEIIAIVTAIIVTARKNMNDNEKQQINEK